LEEQNNFFTLCKTYFWYFAVIIYYNPFVIYAHFESQTKRDVYKDLDELQLVRRCCECDELAIDELYRRYSERLMSLCKRYTNSLEDAEDLVQDTMIKALEKMPRFHPRGESALYSWLRRIAINLAIDAIKKRRRMAKATEYFLLETIPEPTKEEISNIPDDVMMAMIASLPEVRRAVFNLYCIEGYTHKEIGRMLGISEKGSASALAKARVQLQKEIRRYLNEEQ